MIVSHDDRLREIADRVLWLADGCFVELAAMAVDPVCKMAVTTGDLPHLEHDGHTWWLCSQHCRHEFAADPDRLIREEAPA